MSRLAARQWGHVTRAQLLELGLASTTIANWTRSGRLVTVHSGVYALGHAEQTALARAAAAVLACGDQAVLSHDSAAALWGLRRWPRTPEVTAPKERRRPGIRTHRSDTLHRADIRRAQGIRVTSPARTIADIAPRLTDAQLIRAVNDARLSGHLNATQVHRLCVLSSRAARLIHPDDAPTRSHFESLFLDFTERYGLPRPQMNARVNGYEVDALFEAEKVIVELDSWTFHHDRKAFEDDRDRDASTSAAGYLTFRITWARITRRPRQEADRLLEALAERRAS